MSQSSRVRLILPGLRATCASHDALRFCASQVCAGRAVKRQEQVALGIIEGRDPQGALCCRSLPELHYRDGRRCTYFLPEVVTFTGRASYSTGAPTGCPLA
jgi:hypothetical protein